jgi:hypothetical protein
MNLTTVLVALLLLAGSSFPALAEEPEEQKAEMKRVSVCVDGDEGCGNKCIIKVQKGDEEDKVIQVMAGEDEDEPCIIKIKEGDAEPKVIKLKGKGLSLLGQGIDAETRAKVIDERIKHIRATSQLKADLAVRKLELRKLMLADEPDDAKVTAKRKEINALKTKLEDLKLDHELAVKKVLPEDAKDLMMLDMLGLPGMCLGLPGCLELDLEGLEHGPSIRKMMLIQGDEDTELLFDSW